MSDLFEKSRLKNMETELRYLRQRLKVTYRNASVRPENCADAKALLKGIRDDLKPYFEALELAERDLLHQVGQNENVVSESLRFW